MTTRTRPPVRVKLDSQGRILIPTEIREELGMKAGDRITLLVEDGELVVLTFRAGIRRAQKIGLKYKLEGVSLVDELIAERRAEAELE
jgi:AbrB family looped-hinge helix DNA binding protein